MTEPFVSQWCRTRDWHFFCRRRRNTCSGKAAAVATRDRLCACRTAGETSGSKMTNALPEGWLAGWNKTSGDSSAESSVGRLIHCPHQWSWWSQLVQTKEPPQVWSGSPSSQAIPITRPIAPHLVVLASNSSASTLHMELLKLPFSFQWTINSLETLKPKTLHVAVLRPNFGDPITRPAPVAGFFVAQHHWWCARQDEEPGDDWLGGKKKGPKDLQWVWGVGISVRRTNWPSSSSSSVPFKRPACQQVALCQSNR